MDRALRGLDDVKAAAEHLGSSITSLGTASEKQHVETLQRMEQNAVGALEALEGVKEQVVDEGRRTRAQARTHTIIVVLALVLATGAAIAMMILR